MKSTSAPPFPCPVVRFTCCFRRRFLESPFGVVLYPTPPEPVRVSSYSGRFLLRFVIVNEFWVAVLVLGSTVVALIPHTAVVG
ncbi:hypothetical protein A2U01_0061502, partial [Trifolium medium]|nr:hypothetical protein [Trifolium medium]